LINTSNCMFGKPVGYNTRPNPFMTLLLLV
jgi:hypothetical protein